MFPRPLQRQGEKEMRVIKQKERGINVHRALLLPCKRKGCSEPSGLRSLPDRWQCCTKTLGSNAKEKRDPRLGMEKEGSSQGLSKGE